MSTRAGTGGPVDWAALHGRLRDTGLGAAEPADDPERHRAILDARARALARSRAEPAPADTVALVSLTLGGERWAVSAALVWDVFRLVEFAPLPGAAIPVAGITAWRGTILTLLDLRSVLGMPAGALADLRFAAVVGEERPTFGILADAMGELVAVNPHDLREPPEGVAPRREYVAGVAPASLAVLDVRRLLRELG